MNWNMLLVHVIFDVIYFKRDRLKRHFGQPRHYTILYWSSDAPPPFVGQKFKFLASSIVQVSMSSSDVMLSSQLDTYIDEMQAGGTLSMNSGMHGTRLFSLGLLYSGRRSAMFMSLEMRACLKLNQRVLKETSFPCTVTIFKSLCVNVTDLRIETVAQNRTGTVTDSCLMVN